MAKSKRPILILFAEGETDKEFFIFLIAYLRRKFKSYKLAKIEVFNARSISRYEAKVPMIFKNSILPKYNNHEIIIFCNYDLDIFELAQKPPVNWEIVKNKLTEYGATDVKLIPANKMIEDWFLKDIPGLCQFLNIPIPRRLEGKNGVEKISRLFKRGNKVYQKGSYCHKFLPYLDFDKIRNAIKNELAEFERNLGVPNDKKKP